VAKTVFNVPDDPDCIPVNDATKPDKWVVELIRSYLATREEAREAAKDGDSTVTRACARLNESE